MVRLAPYSAKQLSTAACALSLTAVVATVWMQPVSAAHAKLRASSTSLMEAKRLLAREIEIQNKWDSKRGAIAAGAAGDAMNTWVKTIIETSQACGIVIEKIEPLKGQSESVTSFVSFKTDIIAFARWLDALAKSDSLTTMRSFHIRKEEESKPLKFELMLLREAI